MSTNEILGEMIDRFTNMQNVNNELFSLLSQRIDKLQNKDFLQRIQFLEKELISQTKQIAELERRVTILMNERGYGTAAQNLNIKGWTE